MRVALGLLLLGVLTLGSFKPWGAQLAAIARRALSAMQPGQPPAARTQTPNTNVTRPAPRAWQSFTLLQPGQYTVHAPPGATVWLRLDEHHSQHQVDPSGQFTVDLSEHAAGTLLLRSAPPAPLRLVTQTTEQAFVLRPETRSEVGYQLSPDNALQYVLAGTERLLRLKVWGVGSALEHTPIAIRMLQASGSEQAQQLKLNAPLSGCDYAASELLSETRWIELPLPPDTIQVEVLAPQYVAAVAFVPDPWRQERRAAPPYARWEARIGRQFAEAPLEVASWAQLRASAPSERELVATRAIRAEPRPPKDAIRHRLQPRIFGRSRPAFVPSSAASYGEPFLALTATQAKRTLTAPATDASFFFQNATPRANVAVWWGAAHQRPLDHAFASGTLTGSRNTRGTIRVSTMPVGALLLVSDRGSEAEWRRLRAYGVAPDEELQFNVDLTPQRAHWLRVRSWLPQGAHARISLELDANSTTEPHITRRAPTPKQSQFDLPFGVQYTGYAWLPDPTSSTALQTTTVSELLLSLDETWATAKHTLTVRANAELAVLEQLLLAVEHLEARAPTEVCSP